MPRLILPSYTSIPPFYFLPASPTSSITELIIPIHILPNEQNIPTHASRLGLPSPPSKSHLSRPPTPVLRTTLSLLLDQQLGLVRAGRVLPRARVPMRPGQAILVR